MHHPFTSPKPEDMSLMESDPGKVRANAYDLVINGVEIGGGSIRIHDSSVQNLMFKVLGFTEEEANYQFGFLVNAFRFGAPHTWRNSIRFRQVGHSVWRRGFNKGFYRIPKKTMQVEM